jgi:23S rRNA (cytosine1962-C5)-methyltransferase
MTHDAHLATAGWPDYELLDSGDGEKLERFGSVLLARPETQALWKKQRPELWKDAAASFAFGDAKGAWRVRGLVPEPWPVAFKDGVFFARLTNFKHTGLFPEQAPNWEWTSERVAALMRAAAPAPRVLNLFGYTGAASILAARAGARVTHVDASKQSLDWANENACASGLPKDAIRWMLDDALAFAKREARRSARYEGIILDPPAFGRGAKGEVWHIEKDLPDLLAALKPLLNDAPGSFFLLNGYAAGYASRAFAQAVESVFGKVNGESGELHLHESGTERVIPSGIYARFVR